MDCNHQKFSIKSLRINTVGTGEYRWNGDEYPDQETASDGVGVCLFISDTMAAKIALQAVLDKVAERWEVSVRLVICSRILVDDL